MARDTVKGTLGVALGVCLVCSNARISSGCIIKAHCAGQ